MSKRAKGSEWSVGRVVWARLKLGNWWSALVIDPRDAGIPFTESPGSTYVFWFGDYRVSKVKNRNIHRFKKGFWRYYRKSKKSKSWRRSVIEAIKEYAQPNMLKWTDEQLLSWAKRGFPLSSGSNTRAHGISDFVAQKLQNIAKLQPGDETKPQPKFHIKEKIREALSTGRPGRFCLSCYSQNDLEDHPFFEGRACNPCKIRIHASLFTRGDDGINYCCAVCAFRGDMVVCSKQNCGKAFCSDCFEYLTISGTKAQVLKRKFWKCFFCEKQPLGGLIQPRSEWKIKVSEMLKTERSGFIIPPEIPKKRTKLRVLSLFDGIGTGLHVLDTLDLAVDVYYSCEIDVDAQNIVKSHFGDRITCLGDMKRLTVDNLKKLLPIDFLLAPLPCNDFSSTSFRNGLYDFYGNAAYFFEFYRVFIHLRNLNGRSFFWLMENVASLSSTAKQDISRYLETEPALLDAAQLSPQSRRRLFWGNLPSLKNKLFFMDERLLQEYLMPGRAATLEKLRKIATITNSQGPERHYPFTNACDKKDTMRISEIETIFGFPAYYTDVGDLSIAKREQLLGTAWSVHVLFQLFSFLPSYYLTNDGN